MKLFKKKSIISILIVLLGIGIGVYLVLQPQGEFDVRDEAAESTWLDERFGLGGGWGNGVPQKMNIRWSYNWGWKVGGDRFNEEKIFDQGGRSFFTVGKLDNSDSKGDKPVYNADGTPDHGSFSRIERVAKDYPGSYWAVANEPEWHPYFTPKEYAQWYHAFYKEIKKHDPTAKVGIGGITYPRYDHPERRADRKQCLDDPYIISLINADPDNEYLYKNAAWVILWRKEYKDLYGDNPPIDWWNIHPYPWAGTEPQNNFEDSKKSIEFFRSYMDFIGDSHKPLWISEFSILVIEGGLISNACSLDTTNCSGSDPNYKKITCEQRPNTCCESGRTCLTSSEQSQEWAKETEYMQLLLQWLDSNNYVQKWFWYYGGEERGWNNVNLACDMYVINDSINDVGQKYRQIAQSIGDSQAPQVKSVTTNKQSKGTYTIHVQSDDNKSGVVEYYYSVGTQKGKSDIQSWKSVAHIKSTYSFTLKLQQKKVWLNVKVIDAAGNESSVKSVQMQDLQYDIYPLSNPDGKVNLYDLSVVINNFKWKAEPRVDAADIDGDGDVDVFDIASIVNNWTKK